MMPLALLLVGIELMILSWLAADSSEEDEATPHAVDPVLARLGRRPRPRPISPPPNSEELG